MILRHTLLIKLLLFVFSIQTYGQTITFKAKVENLKNGIPIANCLIQNIDSSEYCITDANGMFNIHSRKGDRILISRLGYSPLVVRVDSTEIDTFIYRLEPIAYNIQSVDVSKSKRIPISTNALTSKKVSQVVGISKDVMRAVLTTPGVSSNNEANAKFNVRGGTSDENLILINNARVYNPYHLKTISASSSISVFNLNLIDQIKFTSGGFSAKYGDALSAVLDISYRTYDKEKTSGIIDVSLTDISVLLETPITKKMSYITTVKKGLFNYLSDNLDNSNLDNFSFYDWQGVLNYQFSKKNSLSFYHLYSKDKLDPESSLDEYNWNAIYTVNDEVEEANRVAIENSYYYTQSEIFMYCLNWKYNNNGKKLENNLSLYVEKEDSYNEEETTYSTEFINQPEWIYESYELTADSINYNLHSATWSSEVSLPISNYLFFNLGTNFTYEKFKQIDASNEKIIESNNIFTYPELEISVIPDDYLDTDTLECNIKSYKSNFFFRANISPLNWLFFDIGVRFDYFSYNENFNISPRFSFLAKLPKNYTIKGATGRYTQSPFLPSINNNFINDSITLNNQEAIHYVVGIEKKVKDNILLNLEFYYKDYLNILPTSLTNRGKLIYSSDVPSDGFSKGIDASISMIYKYFEFNLNYGLMEANESFIEDNQKKYCARYSDQRHTFSTFVKVMVKNNWEFLLKSYLGSGYAYTPYVQVFNESYNIELWEEGERHSAHYPNYARTDLSLYKTIKFKNKYNLTIYGEIINVFNRKNVLSYDYSYQSDATPIKTINFLYNRIPSLGIKFNF